MLAGPDCFIQQASPSPYAGKHRANQTIFVFLFFYFNINIAQFKDNSC